MTAQDLTLEQIASDAIAQARAGGATDAECTISEGEEFSVSVRMQEVENLKEAGSRGEPLAHEPMRAALELARLARRRGWPEERQIVAEIERDATGVSPERTSAEPDDLAALVVFLGGPGAARLTGQAISVNGGISAA